MGISPRLDGYLTEGDGVLDLGAHVGVFARALDAHVGPELRPGVARQFWLRMFEAPPEERAP